MKTGILIIIIAASVFVLAITLSVFIAAQSSLPGDILYSLKTWGEMVRYQIAPGNTAIIEIQLDLINRRFAEVNQLLEEGRMPPGEILDQVQHMIDECAQRAALLDDYSLTKMIVQLHDLLLVEEQVLIKFKNNIADGQSPLDVDMIIRVVTSRLHVLAFAIEQPSQFRAMVHPGLAQSAELLEDSPTQALLDVQSWGDSAHPITTGTGESLVESTAASEFWRSPSPTLDQPPSLIQTATNTPESSGDYPPGFDEPPVSSPTPVGGDFPPGIVPTSVPTDDGGEDFPPGYQPSATMTPGGDDDLPPGVGDLFTPTPSGSDGPPMPP